VGSDERIIFDPFCLDLANECLWRGSRAIKLRPKAFAVLNHLLGHPGQLVTKEQLLNTVWPETFVGDAVLKVTIRQLRDALDDDPKSPRFIETAHRRGYRFIGQIAESAHAPARDRETKSRVVSVPPLRAAGSPPRVVGRDEALSRMRGWLEKMLGGERQIVFVTGEAGIGKTALVDMFLRNFAADRSIRIGRGQCLEQYGTSEAYLPILEAIGRLCREQPEVVDVLRAHAPLWLLQMPSLVSAADRESLNQAVFGATRERMLREMSEALQALTEQGPLVLILEDLHWSDYSTLDLISFLATQRQAAQLMLIGTYRTVELIVRGHPLKAVKQELLAKQQCEELPVEYLSEDAVAKYLSLRFPTNRFPKELAGLIHERTEGNPLFMVNVVDYLVDEKIIAEYKGHWQLQVELDEVELGVPENIRYLIEKNIERLSEKEQRVLEGASVVGMDCSAVAISAGLDEDVIKIEEVCDGLAQRHHFLLPAYLADLPDGTITPRYRFIHALYLDVLYKRVALTRRSQIHGRIGERGEIIYSDRVGEIAAELAVHFEQARDLTRAVKYLQLAAENAMRRFAYQEAVGLSRRGLELLERLPDTPERAQQELCLHLTLGVPLIATKGYAAPDVGSAYTRARELCQQLGCETPDVSEALWGLWAFYVLRAELGTAREIAEEFLRLSERLPFPGLVMRGHLTMGVTLAQMGEFAPAIEHSEKALSHYDPERHLDDVFYYSQNPGVAIRCHAAWVLWFLGQPDQALERMEEALTLAQQLSEPHGLAHAFFFAAILHQLRREARLAQERAEVAIAVSSEHRLMLYQAHSTIARGWALIEQGNEEGIEQMRLGIAAHQATGAEVTRPHFLTLLAEALDKTGQTEEGLRVLGKGLDMAHRTGDRYYQAELYRLKGELLLSQSKGRDLSQATPEGDVLAQTESRALAQAEECFSQAIKISKRQKAKSLELRAVMGLSRLLQKQGRKEEALRMLEETFGWFTEGFDTADLIEARALLDNLSATQTVANGR